MQLPRPSPVIGAGSLARRLAFVLGRPDAFTPKARGRADKEARQVRWVVWYVLHEHRDYSYPMIGRATGFDHSTVMHGAKAVQKDPDFHAWKEEALPQLLLVLKDPLGVQDPEEPFEETGA
jgi:hypothetical protein